MWIKYKHSRQIERVSVHLLVHTGRYVQLILKKKTSKRENFLPSDMCGQGQEGFFFLVRTESEYYHHVNYNAKLKLVKN